MNENFFAALPGSFPNKAFKNTLYEIDFEKQRTNRTLELRRTSPISFQRSKTYNSKLSQSLDTFGTSNIISSLSLRLDKRSHNLSDDSKELSNEDFFERVSSLIRSNDNQQICQFTATFKDFLNGGELISRHLFDKIIQSQEFIDIIIEAINNTDCDSHNDGIHAEQVKKALYDVISLMYPLFDNEVRIYCIDTGICFSILNTLSENENDLLNNLNILSQENKANDSDIPSIVNHLDSTMSLYASTFDLISKLVEPLNYARDSILSLGIHELIADIIEGLARFLEQDTEGDSELHENINELLILSSCCMESIFDNLNEMDIEAIYDSIPRFIRLLRIQNIKVSYNIVQVLLHIASAFSSTVFMLFEIEDGEIKDHLLQLLIGDYESFKSSSELADQSYIEENEDLIEVTLKFLGNLCRAKPSEVISLYSSGLCDILHVLMNNSKIITEVLRVLSNLYEVITDQMINEITPDFITEIVNYTTDCNFNCKLETGYFLSTILFFSPQEMIEPFITQEIIDIVVELLECGKPNFIKRSANALARLVHIAHLTNEFQPLLSFLEASDLKGRICELLDDGKISVWLDNSVGLDEFYTIICDLFDNYK